MEVGATPLNATEALREAPPLDERRPTGPERAYTSSFNPLYMSGVT